MIFGFEKSDLRCEKIEIRKFAKFSIINYQIRHQGNTHYA